MAGGKSMKKIILIIIVTIICIGIAAYLILHPTNAENIKNFMNREQTIKLPKPQYDSDTSVEESLLKRRSVRSYKKEPLTLEEVSQLVWAAQGVTAGGGYRTAPSGGAAYPLELYVVVGEVAGLSEGIYRYRPGEHELVKTADGDKRGELARAALGQSFIKKAPINLVVSAVYSRITSRYGQRGIQYALNEAGHVGQNVHLQCVSLGLGTVMVGAFQEDEVSQAMQMKSEETPIYIMPIGKV
jgi:SagB-type dehydrogenase family enzyme